MLVCGPNSPSYFLLRLSIPFVEGRSANAFGVERLLKFLLLTSVPFPFAAFGLSTCVGITLIDVGPTQQIVAATSIVLANVYVPPATVYPSLRKSSARSLSISVAASNGIGLRCA